MSNARKDLIILVADKNMEFAVKGLLERAPALGIRSPTYDLRVHPGHDAGCRGVGHQFLQSFTSQYEHALVMFDREGCGRDSSTREALEHELEQSLFATGWEGRAAVVVFDPEEALNKSDLRPFRPTPSPISIQL